MEVGFSGPELRVPSDEVWSNVVSSTCLVGREVSVSREGSDP